MREDCEYCGVDLVDDEKSRCRDCVEKGNIKESCDIGCEHSEADHVTDESGCRECYKCSCGQRCGR